MTKTIIIIEDEIDIIEGLTFILEDEGYKVYSYTCGIDALTNIKKINPDLILLDLMLPDINGLEICNNLKNNHETSHIPILIVSSKSQDQEIIDGINCGCNEYITKPFSEKVLIAKIKALLKYPKQDIQNSNVIKFNNLTIKPDCYEVLVNGNIVELTPAEFRVLHCLVHKIGVVLNREQIIEHIDPDYEKLINLKSVDILIARIRKKLGEYSKYIESIYGVGYRFKKD